ncbi:sulfatase-like hydrolase/transferase [Phycisphaeraceae bacterium D3-23]
MSIAVWMPRVVLCLLLLAGAAGVKAQNVAPARPNIIIMMADDMGWADMDFAIRLGEDANGDEIIYPGTPHWDTPNLVAMSANGLTFSRMYSQNPVCSPTRASVLSGRSPERIGIPFANTGKMENREVTVAEYAAALGYTTGLFGKWHLGSLTRDVNDANRGGPNSFDVYTTPFDSGFVAMYATESKTSTYNPGTSGLTTTTRYWTGPGQSIPLNDTQLQGDDSAIIARETIAFMQQAVKTGGPFLAVTWFHTPHKPTNTPGNTDVNNLPAYIYAMEDLDAAIGEVRAAVQALGIANDTIILFTSDNGPEDGQDYNNDGLRDNKRELYEGGVRVPGIIEWPGQIEVGVTHTPMVTTDYLPTLLEVWGIDAVDDRPLDGQSMAQTIFGDRDTVRDRTIVFKSTNGHQSAIGIEGRYKLISTNNGASWELYDIVVDYDEDNPLATSANIGSRDAATQAIYQQLLSDYNAWDASVQNSLGGDITGDYETRVAEVTGAVLLREPPEFLGLGSVVDDTPRVYLERQYATLQSDLTLDSDGSAGAHNRDGSAMLARGTVVHSYLIHFDPAESETVSFEITFEDTILGVIGENTLLEASDYLSYADPNFDPGGTRTLEGNDSWTISEGGKTITFNLSASANGLDNARILTESSLQFVELALLGDLDADGFVGAADMDIILANWGQAVPVGVGIFGDANTDGVVNLADLQLVISQWGMGTPPEPPPTRSRRPRPRPAV